MVVVRTLGGGDIAFLDGHAPFLGALADWPVRLMLDDGTQERFAVHGGFVEVGNDRVIILSDVAELSEDIDVARAAQAKARAEEILARDPDDYDAQAALARADDAPRGRVARELSSRDVRRASTVSDRRRASRRRARPSRPSRRPRRRRSGRTSMRLPAGLNALAGSSRIAAPATASSW